MSFSKSFPALIETISRRGLYSGGGLYMDEYLCFENSLFCSGNCTFLKFSAHNLSLLLIYFTFLLLIMYLQLSILLTLHLQYYKKNVGYQIQCSMFSFSLFHPSSMLCLNLIIPNITTRGLFSGVLIHGRSFPFQKLVPKRPRTYTRLGLLSEFYGILLVCSKTH